MTEKNSKPNSKPDWLKSRKKSLKGKVVKLYNFPEGTTTVAFNLELEPESKLIEGKLKCIYTVTIEDNIEKFVPSKTLERLMIAEFEKDNWTLEINRMGLTIDNTVYAVAPHIAPNTSKKNTFYTEIPIKEANKVIKP